MSTSLDIVINNWYTPNGWDNSFKPLPDKEGVYVIVLVELYDPRNNPEAVYVGRSMSLVNRLKGHPVINVLTPMFPDHHVIVYFKTCNNSDELETELIHSLDPKINKSKTL